MAIELCDVNVLLYAFRQESPRHEEYRAWLERRLAAGEPLPIDEEIDKDFYGVRERFR